MRIILFISILCTGAQSLAFAEIIKLKTGQVIDGVIIEKDDAVIKVEKDGEVRMFSQSEIRYIRGEGLNRSSAEYYGLLMDAMNEPDTNLDGWETTGTIKISLKDTPATRAFDKAKQLFEQGQWDDCITALTETINGRFNLAETYFYRANAYYNKGDLNRAIADFTSSIKYEANNPLAFGNRGECYRKLGHLQNALEDLNTANQLDPQNDLVLPNRAMTYYGLENIEQTIRDLTSAIELNQNNVGYYANRAGFYAMGEKYDEALDDIEKAKSLGWNDPSNLQDQIMKIKSENKF